MDTTPPLSSALPTRYNTPPLLLALVAAGLAGNYFKLPIFLNIDFIFGSIFAMLALQLFGLGRGIAAAAMIAGYTYILWNHPYAIIIMTAEAAIVGWLMGRRKMGMVLADTLYWLIIGMPLVYLFYHLVMHVPSSNTYIIMVKQALNGIANALIARLIFTGYAIRSRAWLISYREIIYNLLALFLLCPALTLLTLSSRTDFAETDRLIRNTLIHESRHATILLENRVLNIKNSILNLAELAATKSPQQMQPFLEQAKKSDDGINRVGLMNREAITTAYYPLIDELGQATLGKSFADRPYIPILKQTLKPLLSEVAISKMGTPVPRVGMFAPVISNGTYSGYITVNMNLRPILEDLDKSTAENALFYTLLDKTGNVIKTNRTDQEEMKPFLRSPGTLIRLDKAVSQWIPTLPPNTAVTERWKKSLYVTESTVGDLAEWKLILEQPVAPFQKTLYENYSDKLTLLFLIFLGALVFAEVLSRRAVETLGRLGFLTHLLPDKLISGETDITWPESAIEETNLLIVNFKEMAHTLKKQLSEVTETNELLETRVIERSTELQASEQRFRAFVENVNDVLFVLTLEGLFIYVSPQWHIAFGYAQSETIGQPFVPFVHPDDVPGCLLFLQQIIETGEKHNGIEYRVRCKDGTYLWYRANASLMIDPTHGTKLLVGIGRDITEARQSEEKLRQFNELLDKRVFERTVELQNERQRLANIIAGTSVGTWEWNVQTGEAVVNERWAEMIGYTLEEISPVSIETWIKFAHPDDLICSTEAAEKHFRGELDYYEVELRMRHKDGYFVWVLDRGKVITWTEDGKPLLMMGIHQEITESKKLKEQLQQSQKMEAVGQLAGGLAHDFNNVLSIINGYCCLLQMDTEQNEKLKEYIERILAASHRAGELTHSMLAFSRTQVMNPQNQNLNVVVTKTGGFIEKIIGENIQFKTVVKEATLTVFVDGGQIEQILINLANNARDAMPGGGELVIATEMIQMDDRFISEHGFGTPGRYAVITVSDTGTGMDEAIRKKIFEPFFTTKAVDKGTGLGLAMVYGITKQHNGFVDVVSTPGHGASFMVYLPIVAVASASGSEKIISGMEVSTGTETIMIAEDNDDLRDFMGNILTKLGYRVIVANNGQEAVDLFRDNMDTIQLIIMDMIMPNKSGKMAYDEILQLKPGTRALFSSGYSAKIIQQQGELGEYAEFISKPVQPAVLFKKVREMLDR
ncbi:MAG: PAS domain S-box protein [Desulfuromonadaceae bacterium]